MKNIPHPKSSLITFAAAALTGILSKHAYQGDTEDGCADHRPTVHEMGNVAEAAWDYAFAMDEKWMEMHEPEPVFIPSQLDQTPDSMFPTKQSLPSHAG